ncbi:hypothetical protein EKO23_23105 [Nocardioides guangzhouensis]|uniref:Uncharacterized protein n=1 Tax=Nocardioides guangzhouensis TaxID=2497878 RepID=A0A4Q4Z241_9ACTN|nr:hypothetical protein EKO23_23105 [Nocardioides guangzhouensis]
MQAQLEQELAEHKQEQAKEEQAYYTAWAQDAEAAWEKGLVFYQPVIQAHSIGSDERTPRGL